MEVHHRNQVLDAVTISLGVATYPEHGTDIAKLVRAADLALYSAKRSGRDPVCAAARGEGA